ncbi:MAG TPA: type II toxin-antitoxin system VapC family toxin [Chthoniobacteraceae bacterium]|jgi:predicted nucleic acid-binding protein|nr:type II toxin-antitoxin system VapC family toxin [Chthoniobacteraceae bacterium]
MLIAVDTNVLLDLASNVEAVVDAIATIRKRIKAARFIVPPTVLHEVADNALRGETAKKRAIAESVFPSLRAVWKFEPVNLVPVEHGIVERIADTLRHRDLLPVAERNDSLVLAEAALLDCRVLITSDAHLRGIDFQSLTLLLQGFDVTAPVIATPREIVRKFCR